MDTTSLAGLLLAAGIIVAGLGGLGVRGLGKDSRDLGINQRSEERSWRPLN
jgi:hypothetical protein